MALLISSRPKHVLQHESRLDDDIKWFCCRLNFKQKPTISSKLYFCKIWMSVVQMTLKTANIPRESFSMCTVSQCNILCTKWAFETAIFEIDHIPSLQNIFILQLKHVSWKSSSNLNTDSRATHFEVKRKRHMIRDHFDYQRAQLFRKLLMLKIQLEL